SLTHLSHPSPLCVLFSSVFYCPRHRLHLHSFPTRRSSDLTRDSGTDVHRVFRIFRYHLTGGKRCGSYRRSKCVGKGEKMSVTGIILAAAVVGGTGLVISILLGIASEKFKVPVDEKEIAVSECLPGNNCGGCGFAGCDALAKAIAQGEAPVSACPVG